jgi:hypothetical protein
MKHFALNLALLLATAASSAQSDIDAFLAAGTDDAARFANDYLAPGTNGLMHSMNANWFNSGKAKPLGGFEISLIANAAIIGDDNKTFNLNTNDYNNVSFVQGPDTQSVASVLGENDPNIAVRLEFEDPLFGNQTVDINLPDGIGDGSENLLPTAFIQGAVGLSHGLELKARFIPTVDTDEVELSMFGVGLQVEFTDWLPADKLWPVAISGLVAYTQLDATYSLEETSIVEGENQRLESSANTVLLQLVGSTKLPIINFYGGIGYITGTSESDLLGTFRVSSNGITSAEIQDPFSVESEVSNLRGTVGAKLKLGFFRLNAEYHISEFDAFSLGVNFGFR